MRPSWALLVDLLGFKSQVFNAEKAGRSNEHLVELDRVLRNAYAFLDSDDIHRWALKFFSDNVLLGYPIHDDGESEAGRMLEAVCEFQLSLVFNGQVARGGLGVGELYIGESTASGMALIDAYNQENQESKPPCITLSPTAKMVFTGHARYFGGAERFQEVPLFEDDSGDWCIDYLAPIAGIRSHTGFDPLALKRHRDIVYNALEEHRENKQVARKYEWLAGYHNHTVLERIDTRPDLLVPGDFPRSHHLISDASYDALIKVLSPDGSHVPPNELLSRARVAVVNQT